METSETKTPVWTCQALSRSSDEGVADLKVGTRFRLVCSGEAAPLLTPPVQLQIPDPKTRLALKIEESLVTEPQNGQFVAIAYKPGALAWPEIFLVDSEGVQIRVENFQMEVQSVYTQQEQPKELPVKGPFLLGYPDWIWWAIGGTLSFLVLYSIFKMRSARARRALKERMEELQTALAPEAAFYKELRIHQRGLPLNSDEQARKKFLSGVQKSLELYLVRAYSIPANEWSLRQCLNLMKKKHTKFYEELSQSYRQLIRELKVGQETELVSERDCQQLALQARKFVTDANRLSTSLKKGRAR